jgi:hypothetical protein
MPTQSSLLSLDSTVSDLKNVRSWQEELLLEESNLLVFRHVYNRVAKYPYQLFNVCLYACNNSRTAEQVFIKFDSGEFY